MQVRVVTVVYAPEVVLKQVECAGKESGNAGCICAEGGWSGASWCTTGTAPLVLFSQPNGVY